MNYLVNKGELLGQDGMRVKLAIRKALQEGDREQVVDFMETAVTMGLTGMDGNYLVSVMTLLAEGLLKPQLVNRMLAFVLQLSRVEEAEGGMTNYYNLLGTLYGLAGDGKNAEKYTRMGNAIEAERRERYKDIFNINPEL